MEFIINKKEIAEEDKTRLPEESEEIVAERNKVDENKSSS